MKIVAFVGETFEEFNNEYHAKPTSAAFLQCSIGTENVYVASSSRKSSGDNPVGISTTVLKDHFYPFPRYQSTKDFVVKCLLDRKFYSQYVDLSEQIIRQHDGEYFWIRTPSIGSIVFGLTALKLNQKVLHHMCADASNTWKDSKYKGFNKFLAFCFSKVLRSKLKNICAHKNTINLCTGDILESFSRKYSLKTYQFVDLMIKPPSVDSLIPAESLKKQGKLNLLFVGRVVEDKGVFDLIQAISEQKSMVKATFVGDGPDLEQARDLVKSKTLEHLINFTGQLPHIELNQLYADCDLVVIPSNNNYEGFPRVIMESWSYHKPVIISNVGGINAFVQDNVNGFIVEPGNVAQLSTLLANISADNEMLNGLSEGVKEMSKLSSQEYWGQQLLTIINANSARGAYVS
ncbi:glycosyltransferase [Shewanella abyssi]|uniref:glycosyltransferase n=1 Tax=Shewanella abyssi TaxID=311789 RepID=UPI00200D5FFD|nr:glycosyltransferase [Shewanella abyssi]MCL1049583.1 glycosyltransferase [Shewanella abyssi]